MTNIRIIVAAHNELHPGCAKSLASLTACREFEFDLCRADSKSIVQDRNQLSRDLTADYVLFVDGDLSFELDDFMNLLSADKEVVCGVYRSDGDRYLCAGDSRIPVTASGLVAVDWVGLGFTLVKKEVFENTTYPYFAMPVIAEGKIPQEDHVYFCRKMGGKAWLQCDSKVSLLSNHRVSLPDDEWATVLKAVMAYPLPFEQSGNLLRNIRSQFPAAK